MNQAKKPRINADQNSSGNWETTITRACGHAITSSARFQQERFAIAHGEMLLERSRCLRCAVEEAHDER